MKRFLALFSLAAVALFAAALPIYADDSAAAPNPMRGGRALGHLNRCLSNLDLSSDQQAAIQTILAGAKATLRTDAQNLKADHQKLEADIASGADQSAVGQDTLTQHADAAKLKSDSQALRNQVLAKLSTDQQNRLTGCLQASRHHFGQRSTGSAGSSGSSS